jgi:hypothetical protein
MSAGTVMITSSSEMWSSDSLTVETPRSVLDVVAACAAAQCGYVDLGASTEDGPTQKAWSAGGSVGGGDSLTSPEVPGAPGALTQLG